MEPATLDVGVSYVGNVRESPLALAAYNAAMTAGNLDAADDALDALLARGWTVEYLGKSYRLVSPSGDTYAPPVADPGGVRGPD